MRKEFKEIRPTSPDLVEITNSEPTEPTKPNAPKTPKELVLEAYNTKGAWESLQIKKRKVKLR